MKINTELKSYSPDWSKTYGHIITLEEDGFRISLWDTFTQDYQYGTKTMVFYQVWDLEHESRVKLIFKGDDYMVPGLGWCSPQEQKVQAVADLLGFVSLGEGDTDPEFFKDFTRRQLVWRDSVRREDLAIVQMVLEEEYYN